MEKNFLFLDLQDSLNNIRNSLGNNVSVENIINYNINNNQNIIPSNNNISNSADNDDNIAINLQLYNNMIDSFNLLRHHIIANNFSIENIIDKLNHFKWNNKCVYLNDTCYICMDNFTNNDKCIKLKCSHIYHLDCIKKWIERSHNSKCVICKT